MTVVILSRDDWGASPPAWELPSDHPLKYIYFSYTYRDPCYLPTKCIREVRYLQNYYTRNKTCPDIRYSFLVGGDGTVYEGRGWYARPGLPPKYANNNKKSLYIGFLGMFNESMPNDEMYEAKDKLISLGKKRGYISRVHMEFHIEPAGITLYPS